jgi:hypothetical protein
MLGEKERMNSYGQFGTMPGYGQQFQLPGYAQAPPSAPSMDNVAITLLKDNTKSLTDELRSLAAELRSVKGRLVAAENKIVELEGALKPVPVLQQTIPKLQEKINSLQQQVTNEKKKRTQSYGHSSLTVRKRHRGGSPLPTLSSAPFSQAVKDCCRENKICGPWLANACKRTNCRFGHCMSRDRLRSLIDNGFDLKEKFDGKTNPAYDYAKQWGMTCVDDKAFNGQPPNGSGNDNASSDSDND